LIFFDSRPFRISWLIVGTFLPPSNILGDVRRSRLNWLRKLCGFPRFASIQGTTYPPLQRAQRGMIVTHAYASVKQVSDEKRVNSH
jgi:hypothetical protein